jgi:hypothetical protein
MRELVLDGINHRGSLARRERSQVVNCGVGEVNFVRRHQSLPYQKIWRPTTDERILPQV